MMKCVTAFTSWTISGPCERHTFMLRRPRHSCHVIRLLSLWEKASPTSNQLYRKESREADSLLDCH